FNSVVMALAGAQRIFDLMDEPAEEDHGVVTLVNVSYDREGRQLEESDKRTNLWAWKVPHSPEAVMVPVETGEDGTVTEPKAPGEDTAWAWKDPETKEGVTYRLIQGPVRNVEGEDYYLVK